MPVFHPDDVFKNCNAAAPVSGGHTNEKNFLGRIFGQALHDGKVLLPYREEDVWILSARRNWEIWSEG